MCRHNMLYLWVIAFYLASGTTVNAAVPDFGNLLSASSGYTPADSFAQLQAINGDALNYRPFINTNIGDITSAKNNAGSGLIDLPEIDFGPVFETGASRRFLQNNDTVLRDFSLDTSGMPDTYVQVQDIDAAYSANYTPIVSAVPEPETYAMLLAGLALIFFSARHRKNEY